MIDYICILACGKGVRLQPYTFNIPKILINIDNDNMLTKIVNYWKYYSNNFIIVINKEYNEMVRFYLDDLNINYIIKNINITDQENSYTIQESLIDDSLEDKSLLLTWCDVVPTERIEIKENTNIIYINNTEQYKSRYVAIEPNIIQSVNDYSKGNIIGIYYFYSFKKLKTSNNKFDLCDCYIDNYNKFKTVQVTDFIDIGDLVKLQTYLLKNTKNFNQRFFNNIQKVKDNLILKKSTCSYGDQIIKHEINFYKFFIQNNITDLRIPAITFNDNENSYLIEYVNYPTLYEYISNFDDNTKLLYANKLISKMDIFYMQYRKQINKTIFQRDLIKETIIKIKTRFELIKNVIKKYDYIQNVNNKRILDFETCVNILESKFNEYISSNIDFYYSIIHGDLNLSNVFYDHINDDFIFIDPRGYYGDSKIEGFEMYDKAKIFLSLTGFDGINISDMFNFMIEDDKISFNIKSITIDRLKSINPIILYLTLSVWLGIPYYFKSNISKVIGTYFYALYLCSMLLTSKKIELLTNEKDLDIFDKIKNRKYNNTNTIENYQNLVISKPWGYEFLLFEFENISAWILNMNKDHKTSIHCHITKDTPFIVLQNSVTIQTLDEELYKFDEMDICYIPRNKFHSIISHMDNTIILEFELPPNKNDLYRYTDLYKREFDSYEGKDQINNNLDSFHFNKDNKIIRKRFNNIELILNNDTINPDHIKYDDIYIIIQGKILVDNIKEYKEGDVIYGYTIINKDMYYITRNTSYLCVRRYK